MLMNPAGVTAGVLAFKASAPILVPVVKFAIAWPAVYHAAGGIRHMVRLLFPR